MVPRPGPKLLLLLSSVCTSLTLAERGTGVAAAHFPAPLPRPHLGSQSRAFVARGRRRCDDNGGTGVGRRVHAPQDSDDDDNECILPAVTAAHARDDQDEDEYYHLPSSLRRATFVHLLVRGGAGDAFDGNEYDEYDGEDLSGYDEGYDEDDEEDIGERMPPPRSRSGPAPRPRTRPPSPSRPSRPPPPTSRRDDFGGGGRKGGESQQRGRRGPPPPPRPYPPPYRHGRRPPPPRKKKKGAVDTAASLAKKTLDVSTGAAVAGLKGTGKAAFYLASPKHVTRREVWGIWRFDQQVGKLPDGPFQSCAANVEFTPKGDAITKYNDETNRTPYRFVERSWPRSCTIDFDARAFQGPSDEVPVNMHYRGYFRRKMADRSVIKIVGKVYEIQRSGFWRGRGEGKRVQVGTFTARRRMPAPASAPSPGGRWGADRHRADSARTGEFEEEYDEYDEDEFYDEYDSEDDIEGGYDDDYDDEGE